MFAGGCRGDGVGQPPAPMGLATFVVPAGAHVSRRRRPARLRWRELLTTAARWTASPCVQAGYGWGSLEFDALCCLHSATRI